jgi:hypothetical protein
MAFRYIKDRSVTVPVTVSEPSDGGAQKVTMRVRYRLLTNSQFEEFHRRLREAPDEDISAKKRIIDEVLIKHIVGWDDVLDESGAPLAFSPEVLRALLDLPYLREALEAGLYSESRGASAKN